MNEFINALERYLPADKLSIIQTKKIGIAGAGGLGSNCAQMLVRSGFMSFLVADFDVIEYSNLNRQFYFADQVGKYKVEVLRENLRRVNKDLMIETITDKIDESNVEKIFADCDIIVEAFDKAVYKKLIVETYLKTDKFLVSASGLAGWGDSERIRTHRIKENFYLVGDLKTEVGPECPPLAPCVHIAAAKQADVILRYVLGPMKGE
ncbi:sulfur carrier protein ThiS adenylyltransferase ThiF [Dendrosporobacter sp. 1207_IL3150]|uniref:sulfur carrier protein ThiS adenylyltransferase ThiF n=1 Tax=Dendrosporobacter sp. 1207_IL3150 TaxID=3084054 RepID=UPI002FD9E6B4